MVLLGGVLAAIPVLAATAHAVDAAWTPSSDDGMIALRAFDVISSHPPLLGQYSQSSPLIHEATYSLGPMLYWLLALPAHLAPPAIPVVMAAVNVGCVVGAVVLAGRRGGRALALVTALTLALLARALPVETGYEVWNCWAGLFPFAFLLFLAWSVACGDYRLLPLLAVVASYVVQVHFTYLVPALAATAVAIVGLALYARGRALPGVRTWVIVAIALTVVCWSAPLIEQATHRPGNLALAYRLATNDHETLGVRTGLRIGTRAIGVPPWWAERVRTFSERVLEPQRAPAGSAASAILIVAALSALLALAWRRARHELAAALALALVLVLSVVVVAASIPATGLGFVALSYAMEWIVVAGLWVWLALVWSTWALIRPAPGRLGPALSAAGLAGVAMLAVLVATGRDYDDPERLPPGVKDYALVESTVDRVVAAVSSSGGVLLDVPPDVRNGLTFQSAIAYAVRREGLPIGAPERLVREMGSQYRAGAGNYDRILFIRNRDESPPPGSRTLVRNSAVAIMMMPWIQNPSKSPAP